MVYLTILLCTETLDIRYWERRRSVSTLSSSHNYMYPGSDGWLGECSSSYPITGIPAVSISKLNKASTSMPGGSRAHLYKSLSKPDDLRLPGEICRSSVFTVETERLQANVLQEQRNTGESGRSRTDWGCQMAGTCILVWKVSFISSILIFQGSQSILKAK